MIQVKEVHTPSFSFRMMTLSSCITPSLAPFVRNINSGSLVSIITLLYLSQYTSTYGSTHRNVNKNCPGYFYIGQGKCSMLLFVWKTDHKHFKSFEVGFSLASLLVWPSKIVDVFSCIQAWSHSLPMLSGSRQIGRQID